MHAQLIDGKEIAARVRAEAAAAAAEVLARTGCAPGLATVRVGEDRASQGYVASKIKACLEAGLAAFEHALPASTTQDQLLALIRRLNDDARVHGILVQLPLPPHLDPVAVQDEVHPAKDVDGLGARNVGALASGRAGFWPCTPAGCLRLLDEAQTSLPGARALVIGRSNLVGRPLASLLLQRNATVTVAHTGTRDLEAEVARADVLVAAAGRPGLVRGAWIKPGATVIDVGLTRAPPEQGGKLAGDVEFTAAAERARAITPVPGGVGPMTVAYLLVNTVTAARALLRPLPASSEPSR